MQSARLQQRRPVVWAKLEINGRTFKKVRFTIADRTHLKYKALIGNNILKRGFLVDPSRK